MFCSLFSIFIYVIGNTYDKNLKVIEQHSSHPSSYFNLHYFLLQEITTLIMADTPTKKLKINLGPMDIMPARFRASMKLQALGRQNVMLLKQKPSEIFQMDELLKEAYGSLNNAWRSAVYRAREELGIDVDDKFILISFLIYWTDLANHFVFRKTCARPTPNDNWSWT